MGKLPSELRRIIAANIRMERVKKYPGRGGSKQCAAAFGVSPQQWSPWERGMRTPDELRLAQLAEFFDVTTEYLRRDNSPPPARISSPDIACTEREIIWQVHKAYSGVSTDGQRLHVSLNIMLSKETGEA